MTNKIDTHIITGFLGSGKTTLLNDILSQFTDEKMLLLKTNLVKLMSIQI